MIDKLASLYSRGKLNGPLFRGVVRNYTANKLSKVAASKIIKYPSSVEALESLGGMVDKATTIEEINNILNMLETHDDYLAKVPKKYSVIDHATGEVFIKPYTADARAQMASDIMEENAKAIKHNYDPQALNKLKYKAHKRLSVISKENPGFISRQIKRFGAVPVLASVGALGLGAIAAGSYGLDRLRDYRARNEIDAFIKKDKIDRKKALNNYEIMKMVSPTLARNTTFAKQYLHRLNEFDSLDLANVKTISDIEAKINNPRSGVFNTHNIGKDLISGFGVLGG